MKKSWLLCTAMASIPVLFGTASTAHAQDKADWGVSEVIVTAQKRAQRLQDVPASVTALTAESLAVNRVQNVDDLDSLSPNLTITSVPAGNSGPTYSMRGVVAVGTAPGADKGVALYIDGVYIGSASGSSFDLADIERIEILKGPQGTLFGRNSTGGAISITTPGPKGEFHAKQQITLGNYDQFTSRTRIDSPQWGPLSAAVTYAHSERRGEVRNKGGGTAWNFSRFGGPSRLVSPDWLGNENSDSWTAFVKLDVSPDFSLSYKFDHTDGTFSEQAVGLLLIPSVTQGGAGAGALAALNAASGFPNVPSQTRPESVNNWLTTPSHIKAEGHALTANWQVNDNLAVKNIFAYRTSSYTAPSNQLDGLGGLFAAPNVPFIGIVTLSAGHDKQYSEEFQVDYDSKFMHLTTGGLWYHQTNEKGPYQFGYNTIAFLTAPGFLLPTTPVPQAKSTATVTSYAGYAQGEFHVMDTLDLVLGARNTHDKKKGVDRTIPTPGTLNYKDSRWTYNVGLNYKPTEDILLYAKYATGYISGGRLATLDYAPETAKSWEGGVKADWFDRRLRTNVSLYSAKYTDLQIAGSGLTFGVPQASQVLVNAGDAKAKGVEVEMTAAPVDHLTLAASLGYMDFKYTRLDPRYVAAGQSIPSGRPKWTANLSAQYVTDPLLGEARFSIRADANYKSAYDGTSNVLYRTVAHVPHVWLVNARIALENIELGSTTGTLALWGRNLFDENQKKYTLPLGPVIAASYDRARTVGVDFTVEF